MNAPPRRSRVRRLHLAAGVERVDHAQAWQEWMPHWHDEWSFGAVIDGECRCVVGGQPLTVRVGDVVAIRPGEVHTGALLPAGPTASVAVVMLYAPEAWLAAEGLHPPPRSGRVRLPGLAARARDVRSADTAREWLQALLRAWRRANPAPGHDAPAPRPLGPAAQRLLAAMQAALAEGAPTVAGVAARCGVSRERVHRVITQSLGLTPRDYLLAVRLHRARSLVLEGMALAEVATACGFADQAHFTRWFQRLFGYSPGDLAHAARAAG